MSTVLKATSQTLRKAIADGFSTDPVLGPVFHPNGTLEVQLVAPHDTSQPNMPAGLSVWLYRIVRDEQQLNALPRRISPAFEQHAPLPLRLHYLVTPVLTVQQSSPELEQVMIGRVLQIFHDKPILEGADLADDLAGTNVSLRLRLESQRLDELAEVWEAIDRAYQLSVSYEVGIVHIDSERPVQAVVPVAQVVTEHGVIATP